MHGRHMTCVNWDELLALPVVQLPPETKVNDCGNMAMMAPVGLM